jgi:peptide/nickel transport system substrate-binding protein
VSDDGLLYTFHLRETGFHDGAPCTADDVVYSLNRTATDPAAFFGFLHSAVTSFEVADPATVTAQLKAPWAPFLADLAFFGASILPKAAHEARQESLFEAPIGTGPFVFASRERGVDVVLRKNPNYWDVGKPYLDEVRFLTVLDADERLRLLRAGEVDVAFDVPYAALPDLRADPSVVVVEDRLAREDYAIINTSRPPFADKALRQAMNYAVDKDAIIRDVLGGAAELMTTYLPRMPGHDDAAPGYPFDRERAKALAAASAGKDGFDAEVLLVAGDPVYAAVADRIVADLANIGGRITVTEVARDTWGNRVPSGDFDLTISAWTTDILDPEETTGIMAIGAGPLASNAGFYDDPRIDAFAQQASTTNDPAERMAAYAQIQAIQADAAPYIFLYYPSNRAATKKAIRDFHVMPTLMLRLWETWRDDV